MAGTEKGAAYASLLRGLMDRGLKGVRLVISDDHEGIKAAVSGELPGVDWQRCVVHFGRNVLAHVPANAMSEVAEDLKAIFKVRREKTAKALVEGFVELYEKHYPKAVSVFEAGIGDALTYLGYPGSHHARIRTTNVLERLFREVKRRTRAVGVFPERDERADSGDGDHAEEQRRVGAEALPHDGRSRNRRKTEPTAFETLTAALGEA